MLDLRLIEQQKEYLAVWSIGVQPFNTWCTIFICAQCITSSVFSVCTWTLHLSSSVTSRVYCPHKGPLSILNGYLHNWYLFPYQSLQSSKSKHVVNICTLRPGPKGVYSPVAGCRRTGTPVKIDLDEYRPENSTVLESMKEGGPVLSVQRFQHSLTAQIREQGGWRAFTDQDQAPRIKDPLQDKHTPKWVLVLVHIFFVRIAFSVLFERPSLCDHNGVKTALCTDMPCCHIHTRMHTSNCIHYREPTKHMHALHGCHACQSVTHRLHVCRQFFF